MGEEENEIGVSSVNMSYFLYSVLIVLLVFTAYMYFINVFIFFWHLIKLQMVLTQKHTKWVEKRKGGREGRRKERSKKGKEEEREEKWKEDREEVMRGN